MTAILGISAFYHDSAAALIIDGDIVSAAQEERFTRIKHDASYPANAINFILSQNHLQLSQIDIVVFYDKPFLKFERLLETYIAFAPKGLKSFSMAMPIWLHEKLFLKNSLFKNLKKIDSNFNIDKLRFTEHHYSHAASAFYPSSFEEAVVLTIDGVGEWATTSVAIGRGNKLNIVKEIRFPHSLGLLYSAFTYYLGFKVNSGEYKMMGLAPYGSPKYKDIIFDKIIDVKDDGTFRLDQSYFNYATGLTMTNHKFSCLFGHPVRQPESDKLTQFHMDIASSIQQVTEEIILKITQSLATEYNIDNLCLAGGVALNCVANGKIKQSGHFKNLWIQPASGDSGGAIGAALAVWHNELNKPRIIQTSDKMKGTYLGPSYNQSAVEHELNECAAIYQHYPSEKMLDIAVNALCEGKAIGWFQGKMEFGPRALGGRSILADPRSEIMQKKLNLQIKFRENFRPFAPAILFEDVEQWFELDDASPYMLLVSHVKSDKRIEADKDAEKKLLGLDKLHLKKTQIPAVSHVDYSARIQTVHKETNPIFHQLISQFKAKTGCPILVNTSFNIRGEPIVCTPKDAFQCFMGTNIEVLIINNCVLKKEEQNPELIKNYQNKYELD